MQCVLAHSSIHVSHKLHTGHYWMGRCPGTHERTVDMAFSMPSSFGQVLSLAIQTYCRLYQRDFSMLLLWHPSCFHSRALYMRYGRLMQKPAVVAACG